MTRYICLALIAALVAAVPGAYAASITGNLDSDARTIAADGILFPAIDAGTLLDVYEIVVNSETDANVTAMDLDFFGDFAQVQGASFGSNTPSPLRSNLEGFPPSAFEQDTHLIPSLTIPAGSVPSEPALTLGNAGSGFSSGLESDPVGIAGNEQAPSVLVAQIVMLAGAMGSFSGGVAVEGITSEIPVQGRIGVPEPGTFLLGCMGIVGIMVSRRRLL
jgi:hypothetical protein